MVTKTKRENKKIIKREKILEAAAQLFSQKNYHEVMMDDVAGLVSVAKGTVYNYFGSKEELYFSIMRLRMEKLTISLQDKMKSETNTINSLRSFILHLYMFMMKYKNFFLMYQREFLKAENDFCTELRKMENDLKNVLAGIIILGKEKGFFRNIEEDFAVNVILGSIYGAVHRGIENEYSEDEMEKEREKINDFVLHGLLSGFENYDPLPLKNKTIVITRTVEQSKDSAEAFHQLGANIIIFPTLEIVPPASWRKFDEIINNKDEIDYVVFTSAHAVKMFSKRCEELNVQLDFNKIKIVAVGNKTKNICEKFSIPVHIIPSKFSGEGVINELSSYDIKDKTIFIPRSAIGREELPDGLKEMGAILKLAPVYNVSLPTNEKIIGNIEKLKNSKPDLYIFTSPSTFENFLQILNISDPVNYFNGIDVAAIGPTTKSAIENKNIRVTIMPSEYTIDGLVRKIIEYYKN